MKSVLFLIIIFFSQIFLIYPQDKKLDSLKYCLKKATSDTSRAKIYNKLGLLYEKINADTALIYYFKNINTNNKTLGNNSEEIIIKANAIQAVGWIYGTQKGMFDTAFFYIHKAMSLFKQVSYSSNKKTATDAKYGIAVCYNNLGGINDNLGKYDIALKFYLKSLKIWEADNDKRGMANCYGNIGIVHSSLGNYNKALEYFEKALMLRSELGDLRGVGNNYNNIGGVYVYTNQYDKAFEYYNKALKIFEQSKSNRGIASCYVNLGVVLKFQKKYEQAIDYYQKALKMYEIFGDKQKVALINNNIASFYINLLKYHQALKHAEIANKIAIELRALPEENESYYLLKKAYSEMGNSEKALEYAEKYIATRDSMFKEEKTKAIAEMESKYQSEKKQLEIEKLGKEKELQTSEMKKQRLVILFTVCGLIFVLGFSIVLIRLFIQKKKANKIITEKNVALQIAYEEINTQKEEIIVQRDSIQEQKEIIEEHQNEIEDSINYAKRIQQAVMPDIAVIASVTACSDFSEKQSKDQEKHQIASPLVRNDELLEAFILFKPKDIVSGDFYWATKINEWLIVTIADCTGHGVPGAFMSMLGISFLNEIVRKKPANQQEGEVPKASEVLDKLRTSVIDALQQKGTNGEQKDGMDIALCAINTETLEMQFAGANNPCWIVSSSLTTVIAEARNDEPQLIELKPDKQPIGIHSNMQPFTNQIYQLQKGDTIYLMSDGFEDQFGGPNRKKFLAKNLKNRLIANCQLPIAAQKQILETTITDWIGSGEQIDDITVLGIKINSKKIIKS